MNIWRQWIRGKTGPRVILTVLSVCILFGCAGPAIKEERESNSIYPLQTNDTLTYWVERNDNLTGYADSLGDTPFAQELERQTGVHVQYIHPSVKGLNQQFKLLIASGDLPDIVEWSASGLQEAAFGNYIMRINDVMEKWSPNLTQYLKQHPDVGKLMRTDAGDYLFYPFIRQEELLRVYAGPMIRGDWLEELGLPVPETIDEWYTALTLMKQQMGADAPLTYDGKLYTYGDFCGAYGEKMELYVEEGQVVYGPARPGYRAFLKTFQQWYAEGLIDPDIASADNQTIKSYITQGKSAATVTFAGNGMGRYNPVLMKENPEQRMVAAPHPVLNKGETPKFGQYSLSIDGSGVAITTACKNVEVAMRFLDFGYSEQGMLAYNFGTLGESYEMIDGEPVYTDRILHPENGDVAGAIAQYARANQNGPAIQMEQYLMQYYQLQEQREAVDIWKRSDAKEHVLPFLGYTVEESLEVTQIQDNITAYVSDMTNRFIMGLEPIENFDTTYLQTLEEKGLTRMLEICQQAYERYLER